MDSLDGIIILDKPAGITSATAVNRVKHLLPRGTKLGHAGTLDSFATGVLLLLVGKFTRLCEQLMNQPKVYEATIKLGATTVTDDPLAPENPVADARPATRESIEQLLRQFVGKIQQRPPTYSAVKLDGMRASDRARSGEAIAPKARAVHVYSIRILHYQWPLLRVEVNCGRGTYIRSIARDLGNLLQTGGYLTELRRTRIGDFTIEQSVTLDALAGAELSALLHRPPSLL